MICRTGFHFKETHFDLSILRAHPDTEVEIENAFFEMAGGAEDSAFMVKNNGLCLLIGYAQELIQQEARKHGIWPVSCPSFVFL